MPAIFWMAKVIAFFAAMPILPRLLSEVYRNVLHAPCVDMVVDADVRPERIMNDLKSYASRSLNQRGLDDPARKRWARHGSTRWLWKQEGVSAAIP